MTNKQAIEAILQERFALDTLQVIDDSDQHIGHAGHDGRGDSHFRVILWGDVFENMGRLERQRVVMDGLQPLFNKGLHAISLKFIKI